MTIEYCEHCQFPLSQCGPPNPDGEPTLDCRVCQLEIRVTELKEDRDRWIDHSNEWRAKAFANLGLLSELTEAFNHRGKAIESIAAWLLHRFGPGTPEAREAETALAALEFKLTNKTNLSKPLADEDCNPSGQPRSWVKPTSTHSPESC